MKSTNFLLTLILPVGGLIMGPTVVHAGGKSTPTWFLGADKNGVIHGDRMDDKNWVVATDHGRVQSGDAIHFGSALTLKISRQGKVFSFKVPSTSDPETSITSQLRSMNYADPDHLCVVSSLGRENDIATLFNLSNCSQGILPEVRRVYGTSISFSSDHRHACYTKSFSRKEGRIAIFLDSVMLYPNVVDGFTSSTILDEPCREDGTDYGDLLSSPIPGRESATLAAPPAWSDNKTLSLLVEETPLEEEEQETNSAPAGKGKTGLLHFSLVTATLDSQATGTLVSVKKTQLDCLPTCRSAAYLEDKKTGFHDRVIPSILADAYGPTTVTVSTACLPPSMRKLGPPSGNCAP